MDLDTAGMLRAREGGAHRVTSVELFFDLVYVFAVTQLSRTLLEHLTWGGAFQTLILLVAVWWAWVYTAWVTNWFHPDHRLVRVLLLALMLVSLVMSAALPGAFSDRGLLFASAYAAMQVGRTAVIVVALRDNALRRNFQRILAWCAVAGVLWLVGALTAGGTREALWVAAVLIDLAGPTAGFATPGLGRSRTTEWTIAGSHLAERCQQAVLIAFGESVVATGVAFASHSITPAVLVAFVVAFAGNVAAWWIYFDRSADAATEIIAGERDPGRLGRSAYTYFHLPIVAGIIVSAVAVQLAVGNPSQPASGAVTAVTLGGPALFLAGHALFKRAISGRVSWPRVAGVVLIAALAPISLVTPALVPILGVVLIFIGVAAWDAREWRPPGNGGANERSPAA
jgi:low temperature requirement protein LtrA